jgi:hypothetical protein
MLNNQEVREQVFLAVMRGLRSSRANDALPPQTIAGHAQTIGNAFITKMSTYSGGAANDIHWKPRVLRAGLHALEAACKSVNVNTLQDPSPGPDTTVVTSMAQVAYEQGEYVLYLVDNGAPSP